MSEPTASEWLSQPVRITKDAVYCGDFKLPGIIAQDGIRFTPGGSYDLNTLRITFIVGPVQADDPSIAEKVEPTANTHWYGVVGDGSTPGMNL